MMIFEFANCKRLPSLSPALRIFEWPNSWRTKFRMACRLGQGLIQIDIPSEYQWEFQDPIIGLIYGRYLQWIGSWNGHWTKSISNCNNLVHLVQLVWQLLGLWSWNNQFVSTFGVASPGFVAYSYGVQTQNRTLALTSQSLIGGLDDEFYFPYIGNE